jgi:hypothetical protein
VKAGFDHRFSGGNNACDTLLERPLRPEGYQSGLWILAVPLFEWSLNGPKLISIHMHLFWSGTALRRLELAFFRLLLRPLAFTVKILPESLCIRSFTLRLSFIGVQSECAS